VLIFQKIYKNSVKTENIIIKEFKKNFTQRKDIGTEYFEGNSEEMTDIITEIIKKEGPVKIKKPKPKQESDTEEEEEEEPKPIPRQVPRVSPLENLMDKHADLKQTMEYLYNELYTTRKTKPKSALPYN
jgi:hypothetical protein